MAESDFPKLPSPENAWNWLLGMIPEDYRPLVGVAALSLVLVWIAIRFIGALIDSYWKIVMFLRGREKSVTTGKQPPPPPAPRQSVWNEAVSNPPRPLTLDEGGIPIVTVAAMKGGVGKTTLVANMAAHFDKAGKRVLLIDFDYQGSLSTMVTAFTGTSILASKADALIDGNDSMGEILKSAVSLKTNNARASLPNTSILTSYYEFSDTETDVMLNWLRPLSGQSKGRDARFRLTELLRDDSVQKNFDIVLIDTPPRFTTSTINALCASTHLVIPSILDQMSAEAAVYFSRDIAAMRQKLFPRLQFLGLIPTFTYRLESLTIQEQGIVDYLEAGLKPFWGHADWVREEANIPRKNSVADVAGKGVAYVDAKSAAKTAEVRAIFDRVGSKVFHRLEV